MYAVWIILAIIVAAIFIEGQFGKSAPKGILPDLKQAYSSVNPACGRCSE